MLLMCWCCDALMLLMCWCCWGADAADVLMYWCSWCSWCINATEPGSGLACRPFQSNLLELSYWSSSLSAFPLKASFASCLSANYHPSLQHSAIPLPMLLLVKFQICLWCLSQISNSILRRAFAHCCLHTPREAFMPSYTPDSFRLIPLIKCLKVSSDALWQSRDADRVKMWNWDQPTKEHCSAVQVGKKTSKDRPCNSVSPCGKIGKVTITGGWGLTITGALT